MKKTNLLFKFIRRKETEASGSGNRVHPANETSTSPNPPTQQTSNDDGRGLVPLEQPVPSISPHWLAARSVVASSVVNTRTSDAEDDEAAIPPSRASVYKPNDIQGQEGDEAVPGSSKTSSGADVATTIMTHRTMNDRHEDTIKVKKRRLAKRQRQLNPQPLHPLHNQHPFIRIDVEGDDAQVTEISRTSRLRAVLGNCVRGIANKCMVTGKDAKNYICGKYRSLKRKKAGWDAWNPNRNHPFVKWINESKISGLKEAVKPNRGILYRYFWLTTFIILFGGGLKASIDTYYFHQNSPVLFGFKTKEIPIANIPFPTVTVTPFSSFKPFMIKNLTSFFWDTFENGDSNNQEKSWNIKEAAALAYYMDHICSSTTSINDIFNTSINADGPLSHIPYKDVLDDSDITDVRSQTLNKKLAQYLRKVSIRCEDVFRSCVWNLRKDAKCKNHFRSILTSQGASCSFNHLPVNKLYRNNSSLRSTWEKEKDTEIPQHMKFGDWEKRWSSSGSSVVEEESLANESFPARQRFGGRPWGLSFIHKMEDNGDCPQFDGSGSRITISVPGTDFDVAKLNVVIPPKSEVFIELIPELTTADEELRIIPPDRRGCYFPDEKPLAFYNKYSQENCQQECLANFTLSECKCTLLSFPSSAGQKLCDKVDLKCARRAEEELYGPGKSRSCGCLPSCNQMTLRKEVTFVPLSKYFLSKSPFRNPKDISSLVHMFFGPSSVIAKERQLRHSKYELLSHIGSIFETTNDVTVVGTIRTISSLYVFYPTLWSLLKLLAVFIFHMLAYLLKKLTSCLAFCCGNRRRVTVDVAPAPPVRLVNVIEIEVEDEEELPNEAPQVNYDVFLARS